jgi:hypothetical protein
VRRPEDDIPLQRGPIPNNIQGGVFTPRGRVILASGYQSGLSINEPNLLFVYSAKTGYCFGVKDLGDFGSARAEAESVTVRPWQINGALTMVHVMELDNDWSNEDDVYLHAYSVPHPELL